MAYNTILIVDTIAARKECRGKSRGTQIYGAQASVCAKPWHACTRFASKFITTYTCMTLSFFVTFESLRVINASS